MREEDFGVCTNEMTDGADIGVSCTLDLFKEYKEIREMILDIPNISKSIPLTEKSYEKFEAILRQYQV